MIKPKPATFGTVIGLAPGNVEVYSCDYDSADQTHYANRRAFHSYVNNVFMGYKWQCVEFARRWLYLQCGYIFDDVAMAYDIFTLSQVRKVKNDIALPLHSFKNGSKRHPEPGAMLIWREGGEFELTGHVAIITEVFSDRVRIVEQNCENSLWPQGQTYSRELPATITPEGDYWIRCSYYSGDILGWVIQTENAEFAEQLAPLNPKLFNLLLLHSSSTPIDSQCWLNAANQDEAAYIRAMGGQKMVNTEALINRFVVISESAQNELKRATNELHALFLFATDYVLQNDALLEKFNIPPCLWEKIRLSWNNRRHQIITGRMDFSVSERGIKLYEYNADSASCYLETGKIQKKWAQYEGCSLGTDSGESLYQNLIDAWHKSDVDGMLHIMQDKDPEETYHALFMKETLEAAGIRCKIITGVATLNWGENNSIVDSDGNEIKWVWKTWAWETALDQIREECDNDAERLKDYVPGETKPVKPRLVDVLLRKDIMVYEPLWTIITSNKALLAVASELFPNNRYLLPTRFQLDETMKREGYVTKPIVGRCGENIKMIDSNNDTLEKTAGRFADQNMVYQTLWPLAQIDNFQLQLCTFVVDGYYSASCVRADANQIIRSESDVVPLRIVPDSFLLSQQIVEPTVV